MTVKKGNKRQTRAIIVDDDDEEDEDEGLETDRLSRRPPEVILARSGRDTTVLATKISDLELDLAKLRRKYRKLQANHADLAELVPSDDQEVLSKKEVEELKAWRALGETPSAVQKALEDGKKAQTDLVEKDKALTITSVATVGFGPNQKLKPSVLRQLVKDETFETKRVKPEGSEEEIEVVYVKGSDGNLTKLEEYAKKNWTDFLPALVESTATPDDDSTQTQTQFIGRRQFVRQPQGGKPPVVNSKTTANTIIGARYGRHLPQNQKE